MSTEETNLTVPEGKDEFTFDLNATLKGGVQIPVEVYILYPEGHGLHAVNALAQAMGQTKTAMYQELLNRGDASIIQAMLVQGAEYEDDED